MNTLLSLTVLGSIGTLILTRFKTTLILKYGGSWYYYIWILVLISFCFPYKVDILQYISLLFNNTEQAVNANTTMLTENFMHTTFVWSSEFAQQVGGASKQALHGMTLGKMLCAIYFIGVFVFSMYYSVSFLIFYKKINTKTTIVTNKVYQRCLQEVCFDMKVSRPIILKESLLIGSPMITGILKPTIILPVKEFKAADLALILKHELTHYKRCDMAYKFIVLIIHIIHWFNPISFLAMSNINEACEYSCDEILTKGMDKESKRKYGYVLLNQVQASKENYLFSMNLLRHSKNKNILKRRLKVIMNDKKYKYSHITVCAILSLVVCSNFFTLQSVKADIISLKGVQQNNRTESLSTQLNTNDKYAMNGAKAVSDYFSEMMTEEDLLTIYNYVDHSKNSIDVGTRVLTNTEKNRLDILKEQYIYDGIRPKEILPLSKGDFDFYFDIENEFYYYPERALTDEELLQLIDWRLKINYALSLRNEEPQGAIPKEYDINQSEAVTLAKEYIEKLFDVSATDFRVDATFNQESAIQPDGWFVRFSPNKISSSTTDDWNYAVWINSLTEVEISRSSPTHQSTIMSDTDIDAYTNDLSWIEHARSIVGKIEKEQNRIKNAYYMNTIENNQEKRTVDVKVDMENESYYIVSLLYPDKTLKGVVYSNQ
ncbi:M56 family metallopeptidase [Anaerotignum sp.]|uniref:M56 family metallopeptidase n=1 Tax=Anaerotignum sp. TaxID=2039241 RepID=UPI00289D0C2E|nr:M56 family metallopeptidase [Anaerotignum sp.]